MTGPDPDDPYARPQSRWSDRGAHSCALNCEERPIEVAAQRWARTNVEHMLQHCPLIVLSADGDSPGRPVDA